MSTALAPQASSAFISRFDGPVLHRKITLGSPLVRHQFRRSFEHVGRNVHMVSVFGRVLLGEDKIHEAEAAIYSRLDEVEKVLERKVASSAVAVKDSGIDDSSLADYNKPAELVADIVVPAQSRFLKILEKADAYARNFLTLWLAGEIDDKEKSKAELELKRFLRMVPSTTRKMRIFIQDKLNQSPHEEAKKEAARLVSEIKDEDPDDEDLGVVDIKGGAKGKGNGKGKANAKAAPEAVAAASESADPATPIAAAA